MLYYQVALSDVDAPEQVYMARLSHDVVYASPAEGDTVLVDKLLSMVTGIRKKDA